MSRRNNKRGDGHHNGSTPVWIEAQMNEELDARKLSRAFLALALHHAAQEAAAQTENAGDPIDGDGNACA
jgi:hypothetical protein